MTSLSTIRGLEVGGQRGDVGVRGYAQGVFYKPDSGKMAPSEGKTYEANLRAMEWRERNLPKLPYDSVSYVFEKVADFNLEITAIIVVCRRLLVFWRHGGRRKEGRQGEANPNQGDMESRDNGQGTEVEVGR